MASQKDLVFNPVAYAKVIAKQDAEGYRHRPTHYGYNNGKRTPHDHVSFGCYYDSSKGYGKVWDAVNDYFGSREWQ